MVANVSLGMVGMPCMVQTETTSAFERWTLLVVADEEDGNISR